MTEGGAAAQLLGESACQVSGQKLPHHLWWERVLAKVGTGTDLHKGRASWFVAIQESSQWGGKNPETDTSL